MMFGKGQKKDVWTYITIGIFLLYLILLVLPLFTLLKAGFTNPDGTGFSVAYFTKFFGKNYYYDALFNSLKDFVLVLNLSTVRSALFCCIS